LDLDTDVILAFQWFFDSHLQYLWKFAVGTYGKAISA
jgi:hypothetical protein